MREKAKQLAHDFLINEKEYRLGFVEAEQRNPLTTTLGDDFRESTHKGLDTLIRADEALCTVFNAVLDSRNFSDLVEKLYNCINNGGRVIISGCGSSGRLAMRIEASWRIAVRQLDKYENSVRSLMTGGDYALIRAVESFEDYICLGQMQARELELTNKDILIGVTATGETTSVLGTAMQALDDGASVCMVVCTDPASLLGKLKRADAVYTHPNCESIYIPCGAMAVTGSTRMQSTTIEQAVIASALEIALSKLCGEEMNASYLQNGFRSCIDTLKLDSVKESMAELADTETKLYENHGHVTYYADEYLLDILADTTERGPTFCVPPFRPKSRMNDAMSWAFAKNPFCNTKDAWYACFEREPRCIDKTAEEYAALGIKSEDINRIPKINADALYEFEIGRERDAERESGESLAVWIGEAVPDEFIGFAKNYKASAHLVLDTSVLVKTKLKIFDHITLKLMINNVSTGTMAKMSRIYGNYMVCLNISNKKLIDRAARIISQLCGIDYDAATEELFYSRLLLEESGEAQSPVKFTIDRLKSKL